MSYNLNRRSLFTAAAGLAAILASPMVSFADDANVGIEIAQHQKNLQSASVSGGTVKYLDVGPKDAPTLMLLHGIPTSSYLYREVAPMLAKRGCRVIASDNLGAGASDKPAGKGIYSSDKQAARLFELADIAGVASFVPVLHDVGGLIGWDMVMSQPDRLDGLIALNTMISLEGVTPAPVVMPIMMQKATPDQVFGKLDDKAFATDTTREWLDQGWVGGPAPDTLVHAYAKDLNKGGAAPYAAFFGESVPRFMSTGEQRMAALADFKKPTAIIFGEKDGYFAADVVVPALQSAMNTPDEQVTRIPEAGHFLQEHAPQKLVDAIDKFMKTLPRN